MPLDDWAAERGIEPDTSITIGQWLEERPDVREEVIQGWKRGYQANVITDYLTEKHGSPFKLPAVRGWLVVVCGGRGR